MCSKFINFIFYILHLFFGLDYGFLQFRNDGVKNLVSFCLALLITVTALISIIGVPHNTFYQYLLSLIQMLLYRVVLFRMNRQTTLYGCMNIFTNIDSVIKFEEKHADPKKLVYMFLSCTLFRTAIIGCVCRFGDRICLPYVWKNVFYWWIYVSRDLVLIVNTFVFYLIECRLKKLDEELKNFNVPITLYLRVYKEICIVADKIKKGYDPVIKVTLFFNVLHDLVVLYVVALRLSKDDLLVFHWTSVAEMLIFVEHIVLMFLPAVWAGRLASYAEQIKIILHWKLIREWDRSTERELNLFIRYTSGRPLKFSIWAVVPLDCKLPGMVLSLSFTYLIVVMQFNHLY